jgi:hypothetical protein
MLLKDHLSQSQYDQLKYVATAVLKRFPPKDHYYLGIGRSPSAIISMFQNLTSDKVSPEEVAMNFPASGLHDGGTHDDTSYFQHFDQLLPKEVVEGKRTIVLIDRSRPFQANAPAASGGASLHMFKQILERYLASKNSQVKVEAVGFSYGNLNPVFKLKHILFNYNTHPELERVSMPYYEEIAEWPEHRIAPNVGIPQRRQEYTAYKKQMRERMMRDAELDQFLDVNIRSELESSEEQAARLAEEKAAVERKAAARIAKARAFKTAFQEQLAELVGKLPKRADGHDKGPYLSDNAHDMNDWLKDILKAHAEVNEVLPADERTGPNLVVGAFMDQIERAREERKIRNRDYRRLMGHALSYATMDEPMLKSLVERFESSKHFHREISEESDYYLNAHADKKREETAHMRAHFQILQKHLPALGQATPAQ